MLRLTLRLINGDYIVCQAERSVDISGKQADSVEEWMSLVEKYRAGAARLLTDAATVSTAYHLIGFSCECALKAAIMKNERFNRWPSRADRPDLYEHNLKKLAKILGMDISPVDAVAASWLVTLQWRREYMYYPGISEASAMQIYEAAFNEEKGVVAWISRNYL